MIYKRSNMFNGFGILIFKAVILTGNIFSSCWLSFSLWKQAEGGKGVKAETEEVSSALNEVLTFPSVKGRDIKVYIFNGKQSSATTLVIGGVHGDERSGIKLAHALLADLQSRSIDDFKARVIVIPVANPDGYAANTRVNARGIDINRNFPTKDFRQGSLTKYCNPGKEAASEPETQAILKIIDEYKPELILSFHANIGCVNYDGPAEEIAKTISAKNGLPVRKDIGYATPGSMGTYYGRERNIPIITFELLTKDNQWERHGRVTLETIGVTQSEEDERKEVRHEA